VTATAPAFREAFAFWVKLGFINVGGPTGQIAIMHQELVERRRWIDEDRFLHALSFCMLLPGPEAQQLAIYIGWLLHGTAGGIAAGAFFVLPAAVLILALAWTYAALGDVIWVSALFEGLSAAVVGIVAAATIAIAGRAVKGRLAAIVAVSAFVAILVVGVPFPLVIIGAAALGVALGPPTPEPDRRELLPSPRPSPVRTLGVLALGLAVWWGPIALVAVLTGADSIFTHQGVFFSQVAVVTFGGAYAVLAYVAQQVVARFGLAATDVVAGLGLAESTPGPLIMVVQFLGFVAAYRAPGGLEPVVAGTIAAVVTLWAVFVPSFLWIFVGAPWVERLRTNRHLRGALAAITAAVVGVIASLAVILASAVLFDEVRTVRPFAADVPVPVPATANLLHLAIAVGAFVALRRFKVHVVWVVLGSAALGLASGALR
jgi:chromate transporter